MVRRLSSLRGAHLVMWSSPLLLLVLVLTLTATSKTPATQSPTHRYATSTTITATTTTSTTTTTTAAAATTTTTRLRAAQPAVKMPATSVAPQVQVPTASPATVVKKSVNSTNSSAKPAGTAPAQSVADGVLSGVLSQTFDAADLPLQGPGTWTLTSSTALATQLACPTHHGAVHIQVVISGAQRCELQLSSTYQGATTWQLTPTA